MQLCAAPRVQSLTNAVLDHIELSAVFLHAVVRRIAEYLAIEPSFVPRCPNKPTLPNRHDAYNRGSKAENYIDYEVGR